MASHLTSDDTLSRSADTSFDASATDTTVSGTGSGTGTSIDRTSRTSPTVSSSLRHQDKAARVMSRASSFAGSHATGRTPVDAAPAIIYVHSPDGPLETIDIESDHTHQSVSSKSSIPSAISVPSGGIVDDRAENAALVQRLEEIPQHFRLDLDDRGSEEGVGHEPDTEDRVNESGDNAHSGSTDDGVRHTDDEDVFHRPLMDCPATGGTPPKGDSNSENPLMDCPATGGTPPKGDSNSEFPRPEPEICLATGETVEGNGHEQNPSRANPVQVGGAVSSATGAAAVSNDLNDELDEPKPMVEETVQANPSSHPLSGGRGNSGEFSPRPFPTVQTDIKPIGIDEEDSEMPDGRILTPTSIADPEMAEAQVPYGRVRKSSPSVANPYGKGSPARPPSPRPGVLISQRIQELVASGRASTGSAPEGAQSMAASSNGDDGAQRPRLSAALLAGLDAPMVDEHPGQAAVAAKALPRPPEPLDDRATERSRESRRAPRHREDKAPSRGSRAPSSAGSKASSHASSHGSRRSNRSSRLSEDLLKVIIEEGRESRDTLDARIRQQQADSDAKLAVIQEAMAALAQQTAAAVNYQSVNADVGRQEAAQSGAAANHSAAVALAEAQAAAAESKRVAEQQAQMMRRLEATRMADQAEAEHRQKQLVAAYEQQLAEQQAAFRALREETASVFASFRQAASVTAPPSAPPDAQARPATGGVAVPVAKDSPKPVPIPEVKVPHDATGDIAPTPSPTPLPGGARGTPARTAKQSFGPVAEGVEPRTQPAVVEAGTCTVTAAPAKVVHLSAAELKTLPQPPKNEADAAAYRVHLGAMDAPDHCAANGSAFPGGGSWNWPSAASNGEGLPAIPVPDRPAIPQVSQAQGPANGGGQGATLPLMAASGGHPGGGDDDDDNDNDHRPPKDKKEKRTRRKRRIPTVPITQKKERVLTSCTSFVWIPRGPSTGATAPALASTSMTSMSKSGP